MGVELNKGLFLIYTLKSELAVGTSQAFVEFAFYNLDKNSPTLKGRLIAVAIKIKEL